MWPVCRACQAALGAGAADESITRPSIDSRKMHTCFQKGREWAHCGAARLMKRGRTSATIGHHESTMSRQQHPPWREAAAPAVAKAINRKITFSQEGGLKHFERMSRNRKKMMHYRQ